MHTDRHLNKVYIALMKKIQDNDGAPCDALPEMFFPQGQDMEMLLLEIRVAKNICSECPIKFECLNYALAANEPYGIWGGTTPAERNILKRRKI
jgi:WhiB family transcriptional regulator, redox-sensing transcriptional regulator